MALTAPPHRRQDDDLQALIEEARRRERRRRGIIAGVVIAAAAVGVGVYVALSSGNGAPSGSHGRVPAATRPELKPSRLVFVATRYPNQNIDSIAIANPATRRCRSRYLPGFGGGSLDENGERIVYAREGGRGRRIVAGSIFGKLRQIRVAPLLGNVGPFWWGRRIAYANRRRIYFVGGGSIEPKLPRGATIVELAAHGNRFAVYADWGGFDPKGALFVVAGGQTTRISTEPDPLSEAPDPVWSPDGRRLAIVRNGNIWTLGADGNNPIQLTHEGSAIHGNNDDAVWSPDSREIAYSFRPSGSTTVHDVYVVSAAGGPARRLTHMPRRPFGRAYGAVPVGWLGKTIALYWHGRLAFVPATGGRIVAICPLLSPAGPVSWRFPSGRR